MEKLIDLLKPLIEKYLFTTIISVVLAILGVVLFPDVLNLKEQVGQFFYGLLLFCICFLAVSLIKYIYLNYKHASDKKNPINSIIVNWRRSNLKYCGVMLIL